MAKKLAMHEKLEVHEVLIFKTSCVAKSKVFSGLVKDDELRQLLEEDIKLSTKAIKDLRKVLADSSK
ncbi:spore coat protein [Planococcus sp. 107-1]|uniref:spore coat protein n=1 Tax=Planococcus sp. 107-1 TaxID=2908840 RepID=UPI001F296AA8|nr:spore coat protein [Planococcus sp. 107-1]UJF27753.1 spore coat protein [Planococcus sp. 107-1]